MYQLFCCFLSDSDYVAINQTSITLTASDMGPTLVNRSFTISIMDDNLLEGEEMLNVTLRNTQDRIIMTESTTLITILDDNSE